MKLQGGVTGREGGRVGREIGRVEREGGRVKREGGRVAEWFMYTVGSTQNNYVVISIPVLPLLLFFGKQSNRETHPYH